MQLTAYVVSCLVLYLTPILLLNGSPVTLLFTYYQWMWSSRLPAGHV